MANELEELSKLPPRERLEKVREIREKQRKLRQEEEEEEEKILRRSIEEITKEERDEEEEEKLLKKEREVDERKRQESLENIAEEAETDGKREEMQHEYLVRQEYVTKLARRPQNELLGNANRIFENYDQSGYIPNPQREQLANIGGALYEKRKTGYNLNAEASDMEMTIKRFRDPSNVEDNYK